MCLRIRCQLRPSKTQDHFRGWCCYVSDNSCPVRLIWDSARTYTRENATLIHPLSQLQSEGPLSTIQIIFTLGWSFPFHKRRGRSAKSYYYPHYSSLWGSITLVGWMARMGDIPGRGSEMQIRSYSRRRYRLEAFFLWYAPLDPLQQWHYRQAKVRYPSKKIHIIIHQGIRLGLLFTVQEVCSSRQKKNSLYVVICDRKMFSSTILPRSSHSLLFGPDKGW